jgi:hypothetical protein
MTTREKQTEANGSAKRMREQAQAIEKQWRTAQGIDDKLQSKFQRKANKAKRRQLERAEVRRAKQRKRRRVERQMLAKPLLKGVLPLPSATARQAISPAYLPLISRCPESREEPVPNNYAIVTVREEIRHPASETTDTRRHSALAGGTRR